MSDGELRDRVVEIIDAVRERGDAALIEFTERWDRAKLEPDELRVPSVLLEAGLTTRELDERGFAGKEANAARFEKAFRRAVRRIRSFHERVRPRSVYFADEKAPGVTLGLRWTPIESVGLYIPGGTATYPSTLAMTAIPAQIAGVERIAVVSPPGPDGEVSPQVLLAARLLGIDEIYRVGGAQAIAALALGTDSIPRVDKIFGPGNAYVAAAKKELYGEVGIDLLAGPSEVVVLADESADPEWVAADLLAQAEHDVDTGVTLLATSPGVARRVRAAVERQVPEEPRHEIIAEAIRRGGRFEVVRDLAEAARRIDEIAPEHLSLQVREPWQMLSRVHHAGAIFLGGESPVAVGDYYAGPNHVLPTGRSARFASCLSVEDFMKRSNVANLNLDFLRRRGEDVEVLALNENLPAHARSVRLRRERPEGPRARPGIRGLSPYPIVEEEGSIKLNQNESPWDLPLELKDEVARRLRDLPWNRYAQAIPQRAEAALARKLGLESEEVLAASGSNLLLQWIFEVWAGPGRSALFSEPSFSLYSLWSDATETRALMVPLDEELAYDVEALLALQAEKEPSLTLLCLPNNPTGSELATEDVRRLAAGAAAVGGLLIVDEAYAEYADARYDRRSLLGEFPNLLLVRTASKAYSAAGVRLGYLAGSRELLGELRKLVPPFHLGLFQAVLLEVLLENPRIFEERIARLLKGREVLARALAELPGVRVFPSEANFLLFRVPDAGRVDAGLRERGILLRRYGSHPRIENCLRVNAGTEEENEAFLRGLAEVLTS